MSAQPQGTVTFMFTDIEGSTRYWEQHAEAMQRTLARHDAILRRVIEAHEGYVFQTIGDAFCAAFASASAATAAAANIQLAIAAAQWDAAIGTVGVRIALHSGPAEARDNEYFAPQTLNRLSRILAAAHGGQVLLSALVADLVGEHLPAACQLRDLGEHALRGLTSPERLYQLIIPSLPANFPPPQTREHRPHNLPTSPTPLVGREREMAAITRLLRRADVRLVTLTGPGGIGKSRLSLEAAMAVLPQFNDGVFFISLAAVTDPVQLPDMLATALDGGERQASPANRLRDYLRERNMLLVLDNFEQIIEAAPFISALLTDAPNLKVLVTSREPLHLYAEHEFPIPPLTLPEPQRLLELSQLAEYEAVQLFVQRAQSVQLDFQLTEANATTVAEICARLDGLPLAIELAAARAKLLTPQRILSQLDSRLKLLNGGARDLPARQQSLRKAIEWSYNLLNESERKLFVRLAVFVGGCTLEAAGVVCNQVGDLDADVLEELSLLLDKSLLRTVDSPNPPRFAMMETIREYAWEQLAASGEEAALRRWHAGYYLVFAEQAELRLRGAEQVAWLGRLTEEQDNLRAAIGWVLGQGEAETALRFCAALQWYWNVRGHISEAQRWLQQALESSVIQTSQLRAAALDQLAWLVMQQGDYAVAAQHFAESHFIYNQLGDKPGLAMVTNGRGMLAYLQGDYAAARDHFERSLALKRELGDKRKISTTLGSLGRVMSALGDYATAHTYFAESLTLDRTLRDQRSIAASLHNLGQLAVDEGNPTAATPYFTEALSIRRELGDKAGIAATLHGIALVHQRRGELAAAYPLYNESLQLSRELGDRHEVAATLEGLAWLLLESGETARAVQLFAAATTLRTRIGVPPTDEQATHAALVTARAALGEDAYRQAWVKGEDQEG